MINDRIIVEIHIKSNQINRKFLHYRQGSVVAIATLNLSVQISKPFQQFYSLRVFILFCPNVNYFLYLLKLLVFLSPYHILSAGSKWHVRKRHAF